MGPASKRYLSSTWSPSCANLLPIRCSGCRPTKCSRRASSSNPRCAARWHLSSLPCSTFIGGAGCWMVSQSFWRFRIWWTPTATQGQRLPCNGRRTTSRRGLTVDPAWRWLGNSSSTSLRANDSSRKKRVLNWTLHINTWPLVPNSTPSSSESQHQNGWWPSTTRRHQGRSTTTRPIGGGTSASSWTTPRSTWARRLDTKVTSTRSRLCVEVPTAGRVGLTSMVWSTRRWCGRFWSDRTSMAPPTPQLGAGVSGAST